MTFDFDEFDLYEDEYSEDVFWRDLAISSMKDFFSNKNFHCGGKIPNSLLFCNENIRLVRDGVRLCAAFDRIVDVIYGQLHTHSPLKKMPLDVQRPWDTALLLKVFKEIQSHRVHKAFVPGIAALYLHFCKGYSLNKEQILYMLSFPEEPIEEPIEEDDLENLLIDIQNEICDTCD